MTNVQLEAQQFFDIVIYNPERATAVKRRSYPGIAADITKFRHVTRQCCASIEGGSATDLIT